MLHDFFLYDWRIKNGRKGLHAFTHGKTACKNASELFELSEKEIRFCANLAGSFSKASHSSSVPVDYTLIKYIKKIPGLKGCEVTYTNQKTIYIDPKL